MRVIAKSMLVRFWGKHAGAEGPLSAWYHELAHAKWRTWAELKARYPSVDGVGNGRYVFNIKGNTYRLVAAINFEFGVVYIKFVGTHAEYDEINAKEVEPQ
jgi:mRNA interferase HigB